jgi:uncharacterized protein YggE
MRKTLWFLAMPALAFAQLDDNTLTVTASRQLPALQPDQAVIAVAVESAPTATLDDVLAALNGSGITAANLVTATSLGGATSDWIFRLSVPLANLSASLAALQKVVDSSSLAADYAVESLQVSSALQASQQCPYPALVSDAQTQAQQLATAVGAKVGPIVALSNGGSSSSNSSGTFAATLTQVGSGVPVSDVLGLAGLLAPQPSTATTCTMVVQFGLVH